MEIDEIKKKLAEMQSKLSPIEKGEVTIKAEPEFELAKPPKGMIKKKPTVKEKAVAGPPPFEPTPAVQPEPVAAGVPCLNKGFKYMIDSLDPEYIGQNNAKSMMLEILASIPSCPEGVAE